MSTSPPERLRGRAAGAAAFALVTLLVGCTAEPGPRPIDVAQERLEAAVTDGTRIAGFSVAPHALTLYAGVPVEQSVLYRPDSPDATDAPAVFPAAPLTVVGRDFPLAGSVSRAKDLIERCSGEATVDVWALAPQLVTTQSACASDGSVSHTSMVGDAILAPVPTPVDGESLSRLWGDLSGTGLRVVRAEVDIEGDTMRVFFDADQPGRLYQWSRGLSDVTSTVISLPSEEATTGDLGSLPAETVGATLDTLLEQVDAAGVARIEVASVADGDGARMVLTAADWTELASAPVP